MLTCYHFNQLLQLKTEKVGNKRPLKWPVPI